MTSDKSNLVDVNSLEPLPFDERAMSPTKFVTTMWSGTIVIQTMVVGQFLLHPTGALNFSQVIAAGLVSALLCCMFIALIGQPGMKYGIPFIVQCRSSFGFKGAKIVGFLRSTPAVIWNGIGSWLGARALEEVTLGLFGFGNVWVGFFVLLAIQTWLAIRGIKLIAAFNSAMSSILFAMLLYFFYVVLSSGKIDWSAARLVSGGWGLVWIAGVMSAMANYTTLMLNASDLTRQINPGGAKNLLGVNMAANIFGVVPPWMFMVLSGMLIGLATDVQDPIRGLVLLAPNKAFGLILLVFILLAQVTTNMTNNILPPALVLQDLIKVDWKKGVCIVSVLSIVTCPWVLMDSDNFFLFQKIYSTFLGPCTGIILADYYLILRQNLDVSDFYNDRGPYRYRGGYSYLALACMLIGCVAAGMMIDYSWFVGFPVSGILYYLFKKRLG